jgi:hypothetical protein
MGEASIDFATTTLGAARDGLHILAVEAVNWPDAALGCPQPDMIYAGRHHARLSRCDRNRGRADHRPHRQPDRRREDYLSGGVTR